MVSYETFLDDLSSRLADKLQRAAMEPERISQRQAYKLFGRANVGRWLAAGKVTASKRPGKVEYIMRELRLQQSITQDYL